MEIRIHTLFVILIAICMLYSQSLNRSMGTGLALWLLIVAAVAVRECARFLVAAWYGLRLRAVLLLPIGGMFAFADPESQKKANSAETQYVLALAGPIANLATALMLAATMTGSSASFPLFGLPYVTPLALLRSAVWLQAFLGFLHLLPAYPLDAGRLLRATYTQASGQPAPSRAIGMLGQLIALATIVLGFYLHDPLLSSVGFFIFIGAQIEDQGVLFQSVVDTVCMKEVMLTDFAMLSPSDTLLDALRRCVHTLQEDFPVVRGSQLVGIVNRQRILDSLRAEGNGYVQGIMTRSFQIARPEDTLGSIIRRITAGHGLTLIPVAEDERIVGVVSVQNLMSSMSLLTEQRRLERMNLER